MANAEHLKILKSGVEEWNKWRKKSGLWEKNAEKPDLSGAFLYGADLYKVILYEANLMGADLSAANLCNASLVKANLFKTILAKASLRGAALCNVESFETNLSGADLSGADLSGANLFRADLSGANLSNVSLTEANLTEANLTEANLSKANLEGSDLSKAKLYKSNLSGANLSKVKLYNTNLIDANLADADLSFANLSLADLSKANLSKANLTQAHLIYTKLKDSDFTGCRIGLNIFSFIDFSTVTGLDTVDSIGTCSIDFPTLKASKNVPKSFLLKLGLPELYIDYLPDFYQPQGFYPVFLSHSRDNKTFARKLYESLIAKGVTVFFDEKKIKPGDEIFTSLSRGIEHYDKTILVCSKASLSSWWVDHELEMVFDKERALQKEIGEKFGLLIPITIDDHIFEWKDGKRLAIEKRSIGDFRNWENNATYKKALDGLMDALNVVRPEIKPDSYLPRKKEP